MKTITNTHVFCMFVNEMMISKLGYCCLAKPDALLVNGAKGHCQRELSDRMEKVMRLLVAAYFPKVPPGAAAPSPE